MITSELISYIKKQIGNNISKDLIISKLVGAGWRSEDVKNAFSSVESELKSKIIPPNINRETENINPVIKKEEVVDKYHEPIGEDIVETKIETPAIKIPKIETPKTEPPKVWTPMSVPVKENNNVDVKTKIVQVEVQNLELQTEKEDKLSQLKPNKTESVDKKEEFNSTLVSKPAINSFGSIKIKNDPIKSDNSNIPVAPVSNEPLKNSPPNNDLSKIAMLSSYSKDLSSINKTQEENGKKTSRKIIKWLILVLIIFIIASAVWAFASGYINIKNLNFSFLKNINISFIKKDPKVLLLNNSEVLSSLKSYKTETNIEISSPSLSNISYGLVGGEAISSSDKDTFSINTLGIINRDENGLLSDNSITIKSSLLQNNIVTNIKNNGSDLFISVPDLSQITKGNIVNPSVVKINEQQFDLIPPLFSEKTEAQLKKINIYKILSSGMPSYVNNETLIAYNELINNVDITEKDQENIKGIETYHYSINTDRQLAKNLLSKISDNFVLNLPDSDKEWLAQILGSVTINSFDVWIGKGDSNIYQYNAILDVPLSKIIGFDDKSIGDNTVNINWKTTYYDFNVPNSISIPEISTMAIDFANSVKKEKIKNDVSSFKQLADNMLKAEKTYGKVSNLKGSCANPSSGSLFSPTGHTKGATEVVSSISLLLNKILKATNNNGFCYSTSKAWSFAVPISDNYNPASVPVSIPVSPSTPSTPPITPIPVERYTSFFCIDSTGVIQQNITTSPKGVTCPPKIELPIDLPKTPTN